MGRLCGCPDQTTSLPATAVNFPISCITMHALRGLQSRSISCGRPAAAPRKLLTVRAAVVAEPATLSVKSTSGSDAGTESLALKVAPENTSKGLVHRYLVYVRQNARRVSTSMLNSTCNVA